MNREQRRAQDKLNKKNQNSEVAEKMTMFGKMPNECLACLTPFDKRDKKQVLSWSVVVRNDKEEVRLYCPECWSKAKAVVQAYEKENGYGTTKE